jgi:hypothetical protein
VLFKSLPLQTPDDIMKDLRPYRRINRSLRDMVLEEGVENQMDGKGEKRGGIQKNRRRKDFVEHHTPK